MNWQPMETAPKDTPVLLRSKAHTGMSVDGSVWMSPAVHIGTWNPEGSAWVDADGGFNGPRTDLGITGHWTVGSGWLQPDEVDGWMPLPEVGNE